MKEIKIENLMDSIHKTLEKPYCWMRIFSVLTVLAVAFVLLDTFLIPKSISSLSAETICSADSSEAVSIAASENVYVPVVTVTSYKDANIEITIATIREYDTEIYIADIRLSSAYYLKTAFANSTYGRNIRQTTSMIAEDNQAIFAINGDYYGFRNVGFVLRNGILFRDTARESGEDADLVIDSAGDFSILYESRTDVQDLIDAGIQQVLSFGPVLVEGGEITVTAESEVGKSMSSNPRTAIGQVSALHYIAVVSDGRTIESEGLSLLQLAEIMKEQGCTIAYNLDGGGSSTMWFNGNVINNPTTNGNVSERSVSDIVYIG